MPRATHGHRGVDITLYGTRRDGEEYEDTIDLTYEEWCVVLECLDEQEKEDDVVALLCKIDL